MLLLVISILINSSFFKFEDDGKKEKRTFHYAFFLPESDFSFFTEIKSGALKAAETMDCAISFHPVDTESLKSAPFIGVDGIGIYPTEKSEEMTDYLLQMAEAGIPVIQIENEVLRDESTFYIGTNNFETGKAIGKLAAGVEFKELYIAVIYSEKNPGLLADRNLVEMGIRSQLGGRTVHLQNEKTSLNPLDAERVIYRLMNQQKQLDIVVLTDPSDTLVSTQAIIDMNRVGNVYVVGFGDDRRIIDYIEKDIIIGTIFRNPERIGFNAVMTLTELNTKGYTSAYVDTGINTIPGVER